MNNSDQLRSRHVTKPHHGSSGVRALFCGLALSASLGLGATANATGYDEGTQGDLSDSAGAPTNIGALTLGDNHIIGSSIPSGPPIPNDHGALTNQDDDFFTFTVPTGDLLSHFELGGDSSIDSGDRFFLGIYKGDTAPVDPTNPTPSGLLGYTLPGAPDIGTDLLPALATSNEPGFPSLRKHFSGSLPAGAYTVWLVDGDRPVHYDLNLAVSPVPEPTMWTLLIAGIGSTGAMLRRRRTQAVVS
jgi:hypothetical protein